MLPFHMLAALPTHPSPGLNHFVPLFSSLFSATSVPSVLKSPRSPFAEFHPVTQQPNHFPLFPHPVNIAHAQTSANPSPSIVYIITSVHPGGGASAHSHACCFCSKARSTAASTLPIIPLNATLSAKQGAPRPPRTAPTHYSPPTTHFPHESATLSLRGTHDPL
jgi:hypothetical protein